MSINKGPDDKDVFYESRSCKRPLNNLLQLPPSQIIDWLKSVWMGSQQAPEQFNWLGLAEVAAANARSQLDLEWTQVAVMVYEWLAENAGSAPKDGYVNSAMNLRAYMIGKKGSVSGDSILDVDQMKRWFFEGLPFSYKEAEQKATVWRTLNIQDIKALRGIKKYLRIIASLVNNGQLHSDQELDGWLSLRDKLP